MSDAAHPGAARRRTATRHERMQVVHARLYTALALFLCVGALTAAFVGIFTVHTIQVVGAPGSASAVAAATGVLGQNIFFVRSDQIVSRLTAVPSIQVDRVQTEFPDRLVVYAHPRVAVLAWESKGTIHLLDATGTIVGQAPSTTLPAITGGSRPPTASMITAAHYALTALPRAQNGALAGFVLNNGNLTVLGKSGWRANLGSGDAQTLVTRVATLAAILNTMAQRGQQLSYADLRFREPFYRPVTP